jgi:hypothetical protein
MSFVDAAASSIIIFQVTKLGWETLGLSEIPRIMVRDVTIYCLVVCVSHIFLILSIDIPRVCNCNSPLPISSTWLTPFTQPELKVLPMV